MFERMEVAEQVYEGGTPSKIPTRAETNREGHVRKQKLGEAASPANPETDRAGKRRTKMQATRAIGPLEGKNDCCMEPGTIQKSVKY